MADLKSLITEARNTNTMSLDEMTPYEIALVMNKEDENVIWAVRKVLPQIARAAEWCIESLSQGGRIIYIGAGTSGRLGILDAVECPPTFGVDYNTVVGVIAGGEGAFIKAKEGAEDSLELGKVDLQKIALKKEDIVIGLAASGRTPYVIGAFRYAAEQGCRRIAISCNKNTRISGEADLAIEILTGPEVLTGSTRLKAGTAEKMTLNMISTASMVGVGKAYQNLMVDVRQTNEKLVSRTENIVMEAVGCDREAAKQALKDADGEAKLAITKMLLECDMQTARKCLDEAGGKVKVAVSKRMTINKNPKEDLNGKESDSSFISGNNGN